MKVLAFGEILFDIIEGKGFLGGAPLNFAAHIARLGADSFVLSQVGEDKLGSEALEQVAKLGVKTLYIRKDTEHPTGIVNVVLEDGQPDYTIFENVAYDFIAPISDTETFGKEVFDVLYFGTLAQRNGQSKATLAQVVREGEFKHIFYDVNLRKGFYSREILHDSLQSCTILKLNDEEVTVLAEMLFHEKQLSMKDFAFRIARDFAIAVVIITAGVDGCMVFENEKLNFVKGYPAKVVDTIGAGDAFSAAFLYAYFHHQNPLRAADMANQLGAFVASSRGSVPEFSPEIKKVLKL